MGPSWAYAVVAAAAVTTAVTPVLRRIALATEFVDHPVAAHKSHQSPTPYLGGIGLIVAVLVGLLFTDRLTPQVGVIALGGSLIGCLGLLDDHRSVGALVRFTVELGVAGLALAAGLRVHATDIGPLDGAITVIWVVGVTNAVNFLDNMDGLAAGVSAAAAASIFALAVLGQQAVTATIAAGLAGACAGFLLYNKRPASIFMGDTGSLFLGFVLAVAAISVSPALTPPGSFLVPLMLLALPVLDTITVTVSRLRRGRSISEGGKDHLSHRLVARGLSPGLAVVVLVGVEAYVGLLAVLAGRHALPLVAAVLGTAAALAVLTAFTVRATVYTEPLVGLSRRLRLAAAAGVSGIALAAAPAAVAMVRAQGPGTDGARAARQGLEALEAGDARRATARFEEAGERLRQADATLSGRFTSLALLLPGLRANLATMRALVTVGREVTGSAAALSALAEAPAMPLGPGSDPVGESVRLAPALEGSAATLKRAVSQLAGYNRPYLWPSVANTVGQLRSSLVVASSRATGAADIARLVPALLGRDGPRRYFVAVQDNAELRGGGGLMRVWGELEANEGVTRLTRFGPIEDLNETSRDRVLEGPAGFADRYRQFDPANTWQNVNVSPDFAVTGDVITRLYPQSGGRDLDGVIALDLPGLASLLRLTGPVPVDGWPVPITGDNVLDVLLRQAPQQFPAESQRRSFLAALARRSLESFLAADVGSPARLAASLGDAVRGGHLLLYASRAQEELVLERMGVAGRVGAPSGDSLMVVNQNLSATTVDSELSRALRYDVRLDPGREPASLSARAQLTLRNDAAAVNRTYASLYSPLSLTKARPDLDAAVELGRRAYSADISIPPQQSRTITVDLQGRIELWRGNWYRLDLPRQPTLSPDDTVVTLSVPSGWRIAEVRGGMRVVNPRRAVAELSLSNSAQVSVRLERTAWSRLWARIRR